MHWWQQNTVGMMLVCIIFALVAIGIIAGAITGWLDARNEQRRERRLREKYNGSRFWT